ncbi:MAG: hypothetical protein M1282_10255, partial [Chloroflexi bacterium]|nr:hypothetical protein [Chloroflexota bacterium]
MNRKNMVIGALVVVIIGLLWYMQTTTPSSSTGTSRTPPSNVPTLTASATGTAAAPAEPQANGISYTFNVPGILYEAGAAPRTTSPYWWVDSGAALVIENGIGHTILGALPADDPWRMRYDKNNPVDTDNGYHPQNIFRLVTNGSWMNYTEECYFKIVATNLSASPNRNQSNGLLLFNRYEDHNDLYYAGIRVDGTSVIKKKIGSIYYTMAQNPLFPGIYAETSTSLPAT